MATINGYTAERMQEIENNSIVGADVVGDNLIMTRFDTSTFNAGDVRGPQGDPGFQDIEALKLLLDPPGVPKPYTGAAAPDGYGLCDAAVEYDGTDYPSLAALYGTGTACVNGASAVGNFRLPNLKGKVLAGRDATIGAFDTLHETGGSKDAVVVDHGHDAVPVGDHDHNTNTTGNVFAVSVGGTQNNRLGSTATDGLNGDMITYTAVAPEGGHDHAVTNVGESGVDKNLQPYRVVNWIMRLT